MSYKTIKPKDENTYIDAKGVIFDRQLTLYDRLKNGYTVYNHWAQGEWIKIMETNLTGAWNENHALVAIKGTHNSTYYRSAIINVDALTRSTIDDIDYSITFLANNGLAANYLYIQYKKNSDNNVVVEVYLKHDYTYGSFKICPLIEHNWKIFNNSSYHTLSLPASGYTGKNATS